MMDFLKIVIMAIIDITSEYIRKLKEQNGESKGDTK